MSYTIFEIGEPVLAKTARKRGEEITESVRVKNTEKYAGKETVQLYVRDLAGSVPRPVKELQSFRQVALQPGEE